MSKVNLILGVLELNWYAIYFFTLLLFNNCISFYLMDLYVSTCDNFVYFIKSFGNMIDREEERDFIF